MIKFLKFLFHCNHIRAKPILVCCTKKSTLIDNNCQEPKEIDVAKSVSCSFGAVSKVIAQNAGKAAFSYDQDLMFSQIEVPYWTYSRISHLILADSHSKWSKVIPLKSATTGIIISTWTLQSWTSGDPTQLWAKPLHRTLQKTPEKIQNGTTFKNHEWKTFVGSPPALAVPAATPAA
ncbi:hypothetical protein ACTXT7_009164 [Hymenolepis weldensis]